MTFFTKFRAVKVKDDEIYKDADRCTALISKFATEIQIEMRQTDINSKSHQKKFPNIQRIT